MLIYWMIFKIRQNNISKIVEIIKSLNSKNKYIIHEILIYIVCNTTFKILYK